MLTLKTYRIILELAKEGYEHRVEEYRQAHQETVKAKLNAETTAEELKKLKEKEEELKNRWFFGGWSEAIREFEKEDNIYLSWRY